MADGKQSPEEMAEEDSESNDEDLLQPERRPHSRHSHHDVPPSESDEEYETQPSSSSFGSDTQSKGKGKASSNPMKHVRRSPRGGSPALRWRSREEKDRAPEPRSFMPARVPGPALDPSAAWSPLSLFRLFFSPSVVQRLVDNTNANALKRSRAGKKSAWEELTVREFYIFLALTIVSGLVRLPHVLDYWRKKGPYDFPVPPESMSRTRFEAILWSLHMSDPEEDEENERKMNTAEYDRLFKIKPLYTDIIAACKAHFQPSQKIAIDERMVAYKAPEPHLRDQPINWGYKLLVLEDSSTTYTWSFSVCTGESESTTGRGLGYSSVMDLMPLPLLGAGYTLFVDKHHTSPALFEHLSTKNIGCCGIIRKNIIGFPQTELNELPKEAERGDLRWIRRGELLFVNWMDSWEVCMCSTVHEAFSGQTLRRKVKRAGVWQIKTVPVPDAVVDYEQSTGGEDVSDVNCSARHKTEKWYKTFFYHFLDISVVNSFLLHEELFKRSSDSARTKTLTRKSFREQLAAEMLEFAEGSAAPSPQPSPQPSPPIPQMHAHVLWGRWPPVQEVLQEVQRCWLQEGGDPGLLQQVPGPSVPHCQQELLQGVAPKPSHSGCSARLNPHIQDVLND
ncbi:piggyBac transposable element-derived protein 4-like isoform X2 [Trematomus bernacchii]|nr:piggyBac transposable element-derived protein 4-like isoform X2 [Trematomus bernacchii]XP_034004216.1 piggyBac transposable element-derived protein 4-like isoform X2 [Trematomus bernacchii]